MKMPFVNRCESSFLTIGQYISITQPAVEKELRQIIIQTEGLVYVEEELTPYQRQLDRLMRQRPWPGRASDE